MFERELDFFIRHQDALVEKYRGRILVIRGEEVEATFATPLEAYVEAQKRFELGTFMIQPCEPGPDAYTVTISSSELFASAG